MATVFGAAFVAGAVAAFGINRALDVHLAQARPQVECEPIFVALRSLPQGSPITVWDVALRDWPKAMLPTTALRADDSFEGMLLRYPLREGQPLVAAQLVKAEDSSGPRPMVGTTAWPERPAPAAEHWTPARPATAATTDVEPAVTVTVVATTTVGPAVATATPSVEQPALGDAADARTGATTETAATAAPSTTEMSEPEPVTSEPAADALASSAPLPGGPLVADTSVAAPAATEAAPAAGPRLTPLAAVEPDGPAGQAFVTTDRAVESDDGIADLPPVDASVATATDVVADLPPVQQSGSPTPADAAATSTAVASAAPVPLAPPVPMSPATDIEMPLASITATRPQAAVQESSVLARGDAATPPATPPATPLRYLVVPERIALQADASFVSPQPVRGRTGQSPGREASTQARPQPRSPATPARTGAPVTSDGQRRQAAPPPRQGGSGRAEQAPKATGGWLPKLGFGGFGAGATRQQPAGPAAVR